MTVAIHHRLARLERATPGDDDKITNLEILDRDDSEPASVAIKVGQFDRRVVLRIKYRVGFDTGIVFLEPLPAGFAWPVVGPVKIVTAGRESVRDLICGRRGN